MVRRIEGASMANDAIDASVWFAFAGSVWFIFWYWKTAPWWRNEVGKGMVLLSFALMLLVLPQLIHFVTGLNLENTFFRWYYFSSFMAAGLIEFWRARTIHLIHKTGEEKREQDDEQDLL